MKKYQLPSFSMDDYKNLLKRLIEAGYQFQTVNQMHAPPQGKVAYLRHDVDLHVSLISEMAVIENDLGVYATYFVPLTLHFNLLYPRNQEILKQLSNMGHEVGLHYDMETYPPDHEEARHHLDWEVGIISKIVGHSVHTICMHNPYKGQPDPFRQIDKYVHPHDPRCQKDLLYVSDSCRAWRDESLLTCFGSNPPKRLLLLIHPELWLDGTVSDRIEYLEQVLIENVLRQHRDYVNDGVRRIWLAHPSAKTQEARDAENGQ